MWRRPRGCGLTSIELSLGEFKEGQGDRILCRILELDMLLDSACH